MKLVENRSGIVPLVIALYAVLALAMALAWLYVIGAFAVGLGFSVVGVVKLARKKWLSGVICMIVAAASVILAYALATGAITI